MPSHAPPGIFSARRRIARFARAASLQRRADAPTFLSDTMAEEVIERFDFMRLEPRRSLVMGDRTGSVTSFLERRGASVEAFAPGALDEEQPLAGEPSDLIVHLGMLDTVNDLPGALMHLRTALAERGVLIAIMFGAGSLRPLRQAMLAADGERPAARMHPMVDAQSASALMQRAGFGRQVVDTQRLNVRYASLDRLIADLRAQAATSVLASAAPSLTRAQYKAASEAFLDQAEADGKVTVSFELLTLTGWK